MLKKETIFVQYIKRRYSGWLYEGKIDYWLDSFENFHQQYIIMPKEPYNFSVPEESIYIAVITPPGFINQENETRCYFNATIQLI